MGTPDFAVPALQKLIDSKHTVKAVFTQKPKPKNRGQQVTASPIEALARFNNIEVYSPTSLRTEESFEIINSIQADIIVVVAYGFIIPQNILESKKHGCVNLHPSALPKYRGAAPLQYTILHGEEETDICVMKMDEDLDTGPVYIRENLKLPERPSLEWLHDKTSQIGANNIIKLLDNFDIFKPISQSEDNASYAHKLSKDDAILDFTKTAFELDCKIRAYKIWPGSFINSNLGKIKIIDATAVETSTNFIPYKIEFDKELYIHCSKGKLQINQLQLAGKKSISTRDFINSYKNKFELTK